MVTFSRLGGWPACALSAIKAALADRDFGGWGVQFGGSLSSKYVEDVFRCPALMMVGRRAVLACPPGRVDQKKHAFWGAK